MECTICHHHCVIPEGGVGRCHMQTCTDGAVVERLPDRYLAIWPSGIETVPLLHYTPGGRYLLLSTLGCNLSCPGCVSHVLIKHPDLLSDALFHASPEDVTERVREYSCLGAVFCLNEPTVSLETVMRTAAELKESGLRVGCASNGCMSQQTLDQFLKYMDFMNIGMKGSSDDVYRECGAPGGIAWVYENISRIHGAGVHLEVSVVFQHGREQEVLRLADTLSRISYDIPLHIMRFIPFDGADEDGEPGPEEAETLVSRCREHLRWVYLFNTPGTSRLSTFCPDCGDLLIERTFYGPMGARITGRVRDVTCRCGGSVPVSGSFYSHDGCDPRFRGGYRTSVILDSITSTLRQLGVHDERVIGRILVEFLSGRWLEDIQGYFSTPEGYIRYLHHLSSRAGIGDAIDPLLAFYSGRLDTIREAVQGRMKPRIFCVLSHPFLPSYPDKMEVALADRAGGDVLNYQISHLETRSEPFTREKFLAIRPEVILCTSMGKLSIEEFKQICNTENLTAPALDSGKIFCLPKEHSLTGLSWILGLEYLANTLHPGAIPYTPAEDELILNTLLFRLHQRVEQGITGNAFWSQNPRKD